MWTEVRYLNRRGPSIALTTCGTPHEFLPACGKSLAENDMIDDMIMGDIQLGNLAAPRRPNTEPYLTQGLQCGACKDPRGSAKPVAGVCVAPAVPT